MVHDVIEDKRVLNREATLAAQAKLEELKARFETWLWQDSERAEHLAQIYNTRFNVFARPRHDGSHLTFPGLSKFLIPSAPAKGCRLVRSAIASHAGGR